MRNQLAVERMSEKALWDRVTVLIDRAGPLNNLGPQDLDYSLQNLKLVLEEIKFRRNQLQLATAPVQAPDESQAS